MIVTTKYTNAAAAGGEVDVRAQRHAAEQKCEYREAVRAVLAADPELAQAYAQPASRVTTMATKPAVPVTGGDEREVVDWLLRALRDNMEGWLPGALGALALEAAKFKKIGMAIEEAARRAMDSNPHLVTLAKLLLADVRRNAPENKPVPADKANALTQGKRPGEIVHARAVSLTAEHPHLDYRAAMKQVLTDDPALKIAYAGVQ